MNGAASIDVVLAEACERGHIPGAVAAVADANGVVYHRAFGWADPDRCHALDSDAVFRLASMTKLITVVAVMRLVDEGRLELDDSFARHVPEFDAVEVLDGWDGETPNLRRPTRAPSVREVLSHCSGLSYEVWNEDILRYQVTTGTPAISSGRIGVLDTPLVADPGTIVEYGTGLDWAGRLVERLTGVSLDEYCRSEIFEPLRMTRTSLHRLSDAAARYVPVLSARPSGEFETTEIDYPQNPEFVTGGGCFYSTAADYLTLQRALLADGTYDGYSVLSPASIREILGPQSIADVAVLRSTLPWLSADVDLGPGWRWGLGLMVNANPIPGGRTATSGGWWGIFNTMFWIDRRTGVAANLFMQFVPFYCEAAVEVASSFERAVYASFA
jgi:CubicO group peptidase (beta-lactamase class C family)